MGFMQPFAIMTSQLESNPTGVLFVFVLCRHLSAAEGCYSVVAWLMSKGVDVNPIDRFKRTPLEASYYSLYLMHVHVLHVRPVCWSQTGCSRI